MAFNQIQFQHGMSIPEFLRSFGTEAQCAEAIKAARWPEGFRCPRCASSDHYVVGHGARKLFQCNGCRHQTSLYDRKPSEEDGLIHHSDRGSQGGFNRSSQHPHQGGVYGATRRMDEAIDWQRRHALSWGSFASARS